MRNRCVVASEITVVSVGRLVVKSRDVCKSLVAAAVNAAPERASAGFTSGREHGEASGRVPAVLGSFPVDSSASTRRIEVQGGGRPP